MSLLRNSVLLSTHTTIGLGGPATYFAACTTLDEIRSTLITSQQLHLRVQVLGGGSNIIFPDDGFDGIVLKVALRGMSFEDDGTQVVAAAGEIWDDLVKVCIAKELTGIECLSGIPGLVGGTPIQNVGAYGQEVCQTIAGVEALDRKTLELHPFSNNECKFSYRNSRFKGGDADRFIITKVRFTLDRRAPLRINYPELRQYLDAGGKFHELSPGRPQLDAVRSAVLALRTKKSMVINPADPNSHSVGSFFTNPVLSKKEFAELQRRWESLEGSGAIPTFPFGENLKVPAAWLVEKAGYSKGYRTGGVGISSNHSLALINCGGTARELLSLAKDIQERVFSKFGVHLEREPVVVA